MTRLTSVALILVTTGALQLAAQPAVPSRQHYPLEVATGLRLQNVAAESAVHQGRRSTRVTMSDAARSRLLVLTPAERDQAAKAGATDEYLAAPGAGR